MKVFVLFWFWLYPLPWWLCRFLIAFLEDIFPWKKDFEEIFYQKVERFPQNFSFSSHRLLFFRDQIFVSQSDSSIYREWANHGKFSANSVWSVILTNSSEKASIGWPVRGFHKMQNCTSYTLQGKAILGFPESQINCGPNHGSGLNLRRRKLDLRGFKVECWDFCDTSLGFSAFLLYLELAPTSEDLTLGNVKL